MYVYLFRYFGTFGLLDASLLLVIVILVLF